MAKERAKKNAGGKPPAFMSTAACDLLIVVEAALARFVVALATLVRAGRIAPADRLGHFAARRIEPAASRRTTGEIGTPVAHRAAVARAGRRTAVTTAAAGTTAAAISAATATAAIATATATAAVTTTAAATFTTAATTAVGGARTARTEAAAIAATAAIATAAAKSTAAATTTGLAFDGFTDRDRAAVEQRTVHGLHGRGALVVGFHFEEREAAAAAGFAIRDYFR